MNNKIKRTKKNSANGSLLFNVTRFFYLVLYELQPVRPDYALKVTTDALHFMYQLLRSLAPFCLASLRVICAFITSLSPATILSVVIWSTLFMATYHYLGNECASLFLIVSGIATIFIQLGERKAGELSAYSVFNENFQSILGTLTAEDVDAQIRRM